MGIVVGFEMKESNLVGIWIINSKKVDGISAEVGPGPGIFN